MSDSAKRKRARPSETPREVLSSLPAHRPQRVTARRLGARASAGNGAAPARAEVAASAPAERARPHAAKPALQTVGAHAPSQGFESEEIPLDRALQPPSTTQLLGSALELAMAATQGTLTRGGRLLLGALERLPRP